MNPKSKFIRRLARSDRGAIAPLFLVTTVLILGTSFGGVDLVRYSVAQGRLQNALDGATLSAGRNLANLTPRPGTPEAGQWQSDAYEYFRSNLPEGYMGSNIKPEDLQITYSEEIVGEKYVTGQYIEMTAKGDLPLLSTGLSDASSLGLQASNKALRRTRADLELVMALDNTGSMDYSYAGKDNGSGERMAKLKIAANELSAMVLGAAEASGVPGRVFVGLVPFADTVNVGNTARTRGWLGPIPAEQVNFVNNLWLGCITEPIWTGTDLPAAALDPGADFQALRMTLRTEVTRGQLEGFDFDRQGNPTRYQRIAIPSTGKPQPRSFTLTGKTNSDRYLGVWRSDITATDKSSPAFYVYSAANPSNCEVSRKTYFLDDDLTSIQSAISSMRSSGGTIIPTGLLWAWRMLHPDWRGTSGWGSNDMPRDPEPKVLSKVIVLLTDGENEPPSSAGSDSSERLFKFDMSYDVQTCSNSSFSSGCSTSTKSYSRTSSLSNTSQSAMSSLKMRNASLGAPEKDGNWDDTESNSIGRGNNSNISGASVDNYLAVLCSKVKSDGNGIKIYTVMVGNLDKSTIKLMTDCSSGDNYTYQANKPEELTAAFQSIAGALTELRLTM